VLAVVKAPMAAARLAGLVERGERLRCSWTGTPLPAASGRYTFRPAADAAEIDTLVARIAEPDVLTGKEMARAIGGNGPGSGNCGPESSSNQPPAERLTRPRRPRRANTSRSVRPRRSTHLGWRRDCRTDQPVGGSSLVPGVT
jgi:hypothetical protein